MKSKLSPSRIDGLLFLGALICLAGVFAPSVFMVWYFEAAYQPSKFLSPLTLSMIGGCVAALATVISWDRSARPNTPLLLVICFAGVASFIAGCWQFENGSWAQMLRFDLGNSYRDLESYTSGSLWWNLLKSVAVMLGVFMVTFVLSKAIVLAGRRVLKRRTGKMSRVKLMIGAALFLFAIAKIQSLFFPTGLGGQFLLTDNSRAVLQVVGAVFGVFLLVIVPGYVFTREIRLRLKLLLAFLILAGGLILMEIQLASSFGRSDKIDVRIVEMNWFLAQSCFLFSILLIQSRTRKSNSNDTESAIPNHALDASTVDRLSWWSLIPAAAVIAGACAFFMIDVSVLVSAGGDWQKARNVKRVAFETNGDVQLMQGNVWMGQAVSISLDEHSKSDILKCLSNSTISDARLTGLSPEIDVSVLGDVAAGFMLVKDSTLTTKQFEELAQGCTWMKTSRLQIVGEPGSVDLGGISHFYAFSDGPDQLCKLLPFLKSGTTMNTISLQVEGELNRSDMESIAEVSQRVRIQLDWNTLEQMIDSDFTSSTSMINVVAPYLDSLLLNTTGLLHDKREKLIPFLLRTDITTGFGFPNESELFWDMAFERAHRGFPKFEIHAPRFESKLGASKLGLSEEYYLSFGENQSGEVTDLFVPRAAMFVPSLGAQVQISDLEVGSKDDGGTLEYGSLETLSLNEFWLIGGCVLADDFVMSRSTDRITGAGFDRLPNLKRLDLGTDILVVDPDFLKNTIQVEHLTINFSSGIRDQVDFSVCKSLKTLVYVGTPPKNIVKQLSHLKTLESVLILKEGDGMLDKPEAVVNLREMLPNAKLIIGEQSSFLPDTPEKFKQHVRKIGEEVRKKYLSEAAIENDN